VSQNVGGCRLCDRKNWYKSQLILAMPQGYRAKDHVIIRTYTGSSTPQSVFDWVSANLASRVHRIRDIDRLHSDWYQFQRKSEKVCKLHVLLWWMSQTSFTPSPPLCPVLTAFTNSIWLISTDPIRCKTVHKLPLNKTLKFGQATRCLVLVSS